MENKEQAITGKAKRRRVKLYERGAHDDIRYRGPLSYRAFQIIGWICLVVTQAVILVTLASKVNPDTADHYARLAEDTYHGEHPAKCVVMITPEKLIVASPNGDNKKELPF